MRILVLGSAAGGGFPQWNGNDEPARRAWAGELAMRTQSSVAVQAEDGRWALLNASPDLRQQINERRPLQPDTAGPRRTSPIAAVVLTSADVDHVAGLLTLRERQPFALYAHHRVLDALARNPIFNVLDPAFVARRTLPLDEPVSLSDHAGMPLGICATAFAVPGKMPLWLEDPAAEIANGEAGDAIGLEIFGVGGTRSAFYIPGCAALRDDLRARLRGAALVLFDGTLWEDDEMIAQGVGSKTGRRMGHMCCRDAIAAFGGLDVAHKVFVHINNTNPILVGDSPEREATNAAGWLVANDGLEIVL